MGGGGKDSDDFRKFGPYHIISVDWTDSYHRAAVAASMINGVYVMQRDKAKKREPLADLWWEFFGFSRVERLINDADGSIYGAVFENNNYHNTSMAPRYVIAFRGTLLHFKTGFSDMKQNLRCIWANLREGERLQHAIQAIKTVLDRPTCKPTSVWLAGHSLGAGIALMAGKQMARSGVLLETYAFNPPHTSVPVEQVLENEVVKGGFRFANTLFRGTLSTVASLFDSQIRDDDPIVAEWRPQLYVNSADIICSEYIADFKHKNRMARFLLEGIVRARDRISFRSLVFGEGTLSSLSAEPVQLLSSADMIINKNDSTRLVQLLKHPWKPHKLKQWWEPDPALRANWKIRSITKS
ncbi:hypothetical protein CARUB_v10001289mg [Capsella rubella]|uniref:Fungal lipase-type domain-containing protein n=1 Tax=Capsella rubella TaxID=81985 RepID=R0FFE6_9BRAS|nr:GDSL esterase/lipase At4g10955 [Capsella rubella]EOA20957.1 hypothetical protein CARUB_v10001289mg [Capsella rubella]